VARAKNSKPVQTLYLFRGDKNYRGGAVGIPLDSEEAHAADIRNPADHVLGKRCGETSIYTSFTLRLTVAQRFAGSSHWIIKIKIEDIIAWNGRGISGSCIRIRFSTYYLRRRFR
jgi:hypothetical protein